MSKSTLIPFGPQHPVFLEPINLQLELDEERVVGASLNFGYAHRGMEKAMAADFRRSIYLSERICGICSFYHTSAYCQGMEAIFNVVPPERAKHVRIVMMELQRLTSHLLALGHTAEAIGYESLFMQCFRERERIMRLVNSISGNRVHYSMNTIGGVRGDISPEQGKEVLKALDDLESGFADLAAVFHRDGTIRRRMAGVGVLGADQARSYGVVGPVARASGLRQDLRLLYYEDLDFRPVVREEGDAYARTLVRVDEITQSIELVRQALGRMPEGPLLALVKGNPPPGESFTRLEAPRGEMLYYILAKGKTELERIKVKTPTFMNAAALKAMVPGCEVADIPTITVSVDPCICCTER